MFLLISDFSLLKLCTFKYGIKSGIFWRGVIDHQSALGCDLGENKKVGSIHRKTFLNH